MTRLDAEGADRCYFGIADYRLHVSPQLLDQNDGPMLEALKKLQGVSVHLPKRPKDYPDRDRLSLRFERFKAAY
jgi:putative restriction endonuclease